MAKFVIIRKENNLDKWIRYFGYLFCAGVIWNARGAYDDFRAKFDFPIPDSPDDLRKDNGHKDD